MPRWGLTDEQRAQEPWGIPSELLTPGRRFTDPVHGSVYLSRLEMRLLDSPPLARLRQVRQLGTTRLVYPGATHDRFSHILGTLISAQELFDAAFQRDRLGAIPRDLFQEWRDTKDEEGFAKSVAEAMVLARLGALLHDMCHIPYGHTIEDDLEVLTSHDANESRFEHLWSMVPNEIRSVVEGPFLEALLPIIISKEAGDDGLVSRAVEEHPYPFVLDIVGNTICADLLDYLKRDHHYTGLPYAAGTRFMESFYVTPRDHLHPERMVVKVSNGGVLRNDSITELLKFLRYRYELNERALNHKTKLAADAMVGKLLDMYSNALWVDTAIENGIGVPPADYDEIAAVRTAAGSRAAEIDDRVKQALEREFLRRSDDGILEYLRYDWKPTAEKTKRETAIKDMAQLLLERKLFKRIGVSTSALGNARSIREKFGKAEQRRKLEFGVAEYAELQHRWHVVLWIPSPTMRLKPAEVLVDDGGQVAPLKDLLKGDSRRLAQEIIEMHERLWAVSAFAHQSVRDDPELRSVVLTWLSERMHGIAWDDLAQKPLGLVDLAVDNIRRTRQMTFDESSQLRASLNAVAAKGQAPTWKGLISMANDVAEQGPLGKPPEKDAYPAEAPPAGQADQPLPAPGGLFDNQPGS